MAYCPKCNKSMGTTEAVCPHCGYDFPEEKEKPAEKKGIAYSHLAEIALQIGIVVAAIASVFCLGWTFILVLSLKAIPAFYALIGFFLSLANFVAFVRIQDLSPQNRISD